MSYGFITGRNTEANEKAWNLSSDYTLVYRNDRISVVMWYGDKHEREMDGVDTEGELTESDVLDIAEEERMIDKSQKNNGDFLVCNYNIYGSGDIRTFCDTIQEAVNEASEIRRRYVSNSEKMSVTISRYNPVCDRGYYIELNNLEIAHLMGKL